MYRQNIKVFIYILSVFSFYKLSSQITLTPSVGCAPFAVNFTGPAGATGITWNFGDSPLTSNLAAPSHVYQNIGTYTVTYNATVGGNPVTYTAAVVAHGKPTASFNFNVPSIHCKPLVVPFTSTSSGPAPLTYTWNFGDGGQITGTNGTPTYTYALQGAFYASLIVADANGCTSTLTPQQGPINVSTPPTVNITSNPLSLSSCTTPFIAAFSGSTSVSGSPISGPLSSYSWNFGNSQTSNQMNTAGITYTTGSYNVTLTVTDNNNCSASAVRPVSVSQPTISAIIPGTVCIGVPFTFTYQTNQPSSTWNFIPITTTVLPAASPTAINTNTFIYTSSGTKTISISVGNFPCISVLTKTVYVEQVVASFSFTPPSFTCSPSFIATYTNQSSSNATSYVWTVTQYNSTTYTSNATNPTFTLTQGSLNPYTYYQTYGALVTLIAKSANGCVSTDTMHIYDSIRRPTAWFNTDKSEGCVPLTVKFRDSSETNVSIYPITSYTWNNGANPATIVTGSIPPAMINPVFTYTAAGTYTPFLSIQTASGCVHTSYVHTITVVNPPVINFNVTPTGPVCWNQPITINATSTSTAPIHHWHVSGDNGFFSGCVNNASPQWNFTHIGVHTFTVDGYLSGCKGTATSTQSITVKGPIVQSRYQTNCTPGTRKSINFYTQVQDAGSAILNFGDAATSTVAIACLPGGIATHTATHIYTASGDYTASVTAVSSNGCPAYTYTMLVTVRDIQANFTLTSVGCTSITQTFDATSSQDVHVGCTRGYVWYFDNLPPTDNIQPIITNYFTTAGTHSVLLMVKDDNSCVDTTMHTIRISSADPSFAFSSGTICLSSGTVQALNTTIQTPDPVSNFNWDFGDGTLPFTTTVLTSPTHTYYNSSSPSQNYTVVLTATNSIGCIDTTVRILTVVNPQAYIIPSLFQMCIPSTTNNLATNTISFTAPSAYSSYTFNYGDGSPAYTGTNNVSPSHTYSIAGAYTASITVNLGGCQSSANVNINAQNYAIPDFSLSTNQICKDQQVIFTNTSTSLTPTYTPNWNLSTGSNILPQDVVAWTYTAVGTPVITLSITTSNGCISVISKTLSVLGPKANLVLDKQTVCLGSDIKFSIKNDSSNVYGWTYDFQDGVAPTYTANSSPTPTVSHTYTNYPPSGNTYVSFTYSASGKQCPATFTLPIQVINIVGDFKRNNEISAIDYNHCIGITDQFNNQTPNSNAYTFNWNFGDGLGSSGSQNPAYTYPNAGVYTVSLSITDPVNNCKGIAVKNMTINPLPVVKAFSKDSVCQNLPFALTSATLAGTPAFTYTWNPSAGLATPNSYSTNATASISTTYTLLIQDANGCKNSTTKGIYIQLPPANIHWDTTVIVGQSIPLSNNSGSNFTYTWNPTTDLSCANCPYPISTSTVNITYSVTIADKLGCFKVVNTHTVYVELKGTVDVPTAFTPNGDGVNDIIYVDGWGIRKLNYFRIFNRWGQLLFESNDIKIGWDGTFNGVPQNLETYVYQVSAITYAAEGKETLKTGSFKLIR